MSSTSPRLAGNGVAFTVCVEFIHHDCVITAGALAQFDHPDPDADMLSTFQAHEANIKGVARRLVSAGVPGTPLRLDASTFRYS